jgi:hypothetical protein
LRKSAASISRALVNFARKAEEKSDITGRKEGKKKKN